MTIKVKANGLTFSFPDGTTTAQIEQVLDEHFNKPSAAETFFTEAGKVAVTSLAKMAGSAADIMVPDVVKAGAEKVLPEDIYNAYFDPEKLTQDKGLAPETTVGQVASEVIPAVAGGFAGSTGLAGVGVRYGNRLMKYGADNLASSFGAQLASGHDITAGTTAGDVALGTALNLAMPKVGGALKTILRGKREGEFVDAVQTINAATPAGVDFTPSRGMTTLNKLTLGTEKHLENTLGSSGVMQRVNDANNEALNSFADGLRRAMAGADDMSTEEIGNALSKGFQELAEAQAKESDMYFEQAVQLAGGHRIALNRTRKQLQRITAIARNNPDLEELIQSPQFRQLVKGINGKAPDLPGLIRLKGVVSKMIEGTGQGTKSTDKRDLTILYNALNDDAARSLDGAGWGALANWTKGNSVHNALRDMERRAAPVFGDGIAGDELYARIFGKPGDALRNNNADTTRLILSMLPEELQARVRSEMIYRAGREAAGQAGNEGRKFSAAAFLTNWNKLTPEVQDIVSAGHRADIDALAVVSGRLKELGRAANFSNTANHLSAANALQLMGAAATGGWSAMITPLLANLSARALTNPEFASTLWRLASSAQNDGEVFRALIRLAVIAEQDPEIAVDYQILSEGLSQ